MTLADILAFALGIEKSWPPLPEPLPPPPDPPRAPGERGAA